MGRPDVNRSGEMEVFVRAVDLGGFSAAARAARISPSAVSKLIGRLERRLGARLVNRSTRRLQLTPEGTEFYQRAVRILADLDEAERGAAASGIPAGRLRINANIPFGQRFLVPLAPLFLARHPDITLDIVLTDAVIDLLDERTDVAVRAGPLKSSALTARKLGATRSVIVGAPSYLARHGTPQTPADLERHNRLGLGYARAIEGWPLRDGGVDLNLPLVGNTRISDGETLRLLVLAGLGLARMAEFMVRDDLRAGRLVALMEAFNPGDLEEFHAVFLGRGAHLPARVRALLDFLVEHVRFG
jgi:DNA-binding transcriptional LysR family regulator